MAWGAIKRPLDPDLDQTSTFSMNSGDRTWAVRKKVDSWFGNELRASGTLWKDLQEDKWQLTDTGPVQNCTPKGILQQMQKHLMVCRKFTFTSQTGQTSMCFGMFPKCDNPGCQTRVGPWRTPSQQKCWCKHILFAMVYILKIQAGSPLLLQTAMSATTAHASLTKAKTSIPKGKTNEAKQPKQPVKPGTAPRASPANNVKRRRQSNAAAGRLPATKKTTGLKATLLSPQKLVGTTWLPLQLEADLWYAANYAGQHGRTCCGRYSTEQHTCGSGRKLVQGEVVLIGTFSQNCWRYNKGSDTSQQQVTEAKQTHRIILQCVPLLPAPSKAHPEHVR
jgi:hypothetical protein